MDRTIEAGNQVHTYDQVQTFIDRYDPIAVTTCYCRHAAALREEDIHGMPLDVCMQFGTGAQFAIDRLGGRKVSKQEAREVLNRAEEAGLIHMNMNMTEDIGFICNCDRWHCVMVKQVLAKPNPPCFLTPAMSPVSMPIAAWPAKFVSSAALRKRLPWGKTESPRRISTGVSDAPSAPPAAPRKRSLWSTNRASRDPLKMEKPCRRRSRRVRAPCD